MSSHAADPRHRRAPLAFAALMVAALASACSGGAAVPSSPGTSAGQPSGRSTPAAAAAPTSPPAPAGDSSTRPEGAWTFVTWTTRRSDLKVDQPLARVILGSLTPSCSSGPCDLTLEPAGLDGTYEDPNGPPASDYVSSTKPVALQLKGKSYVGRTPSRVLPCTPKVGVPSIPDGYSTQTTMTLNFTPPSGGKPAHLYGTVAFTNKGTRAGKPKGCTDYSETRAIAGSPKGSLDSATAPRGTYDASMSSRGSSPTSLAPVGTSFWLGTMPAVATSNLLTITGVTSKAAPPEAQ